MRRTDLIRNFLKGSNKGKASSLNIQGEKIYSYSTPIGIKQGNVLKFNKRKYSHTTSCQQNELKRQAKECGFNIEEFEF